MRNMTFNETFESSLVQKNPQKFTIQRSLAQGIKDNDVTKIIETNQQGGLSNQKLILDDKKQIQGVVIDTRKRLDEVRTTINKKQSSIINLKNKKQLLEIEQSKYEEFTNKQKNQLNSTKQKLNKVNETLQSTVLKKDVYLHMKDTIKKDILVLKKRYFDLDVQLMRDQTKLKTLRNQHSNKIKLSKRCREMLDSVEKSVNNKHQERSNKIQSVHEVISQKQNNLRNKEIRGQEMEQVMLTAMTDKLEHEKQWIKMLNTNIFLSNILKNKMSKVMLEHQQVQIAYHKMKQATSIKNSGELIDKYLDRQKIYGNLLDSITQKEQILEKIKEQNQQLKYQHSQFQYKTDQIVDNSKHKQTEDVNFQKIISSYNQELITIYRQKQQIYNWATKFLASYYGHQNKDVIANKYKRTQTKQLMIDVLNVVKEFMNDLSNQKESDKKIEEAYLKNNFKESVLSSQNWEKNTRIKTLSTYENQMQGDTFQDKDMAYDDISEEDYFQHNRRAIKKNDLQNRRFRIKTKPY